MKRFLVLALGTTALASASLAVQYGPGAGGLIPDNLPAGFSSSINIGVGITSVQSVEIRGLKHTWAGDLTATLTNPNGASVILFQRVGSTTPTGFGDSTNFGSDDPVGGAGSDANNLTGRDYIFGESGADLWTTGAGLAGGVGMPAGSYLMFSNNFNTTTPYTFTSFAGMGTNLTGDWILTLSDGAGGDINGAYTEWYLNATPVPEPATLAALGLGAAALLRRRKKAA